MKSTDSRWALVNLRPYSLALVCRQYAPPGKRWPRLMLAIYADQESGRVRVSIDEKRRAGAWWEKAALPRELLSDLAELLIEASAP